MMQPLLGVDDIEELLSAYADAGVSEGDLMLRAGAAVAAQAACLIDGGTVVVMCGMGRNGGDGWVAADCLASRGCEVCVVTAATPALMKDELARKMADHAIEMGVPVHVDPDRERLEDLLSSADVVVDAVFGTGLRGAMPATYRGWVEAVDEAFVGVVVSVDVPSGIHADSGMADGAFFSADMTVSMFAPKPGLVSGFGSLASGTVVVSDLARAGEDLPDPSDVARAVLVDDADLDGVVPDPGPLVDKYSRGRVLVVAGSARYPGAAIMAARAASRSGAGYVTLAVPSGIVDCARAHLLDIPVVGLEQDADGAFAEGAADEVRELAAHAHVVVAGPGMTTAFGPCEVVRALLGCPCALVLDADALNAAVKVCCGSLPAHPQPLRRGAPLVLTPHRRELARLVGGDPQAVSTMIDSIDAAQSIAWSVGSRDFAVVAKGPETCIVGVDGAYVVEPGPSALATAGSGDVLAGMVGGMLAVAVAASGGERLECAELLCLLAAADRAHAVAGELAVERHGARGVVATDLLELVGLAFDELERRAEEAAARALGDGGEPCPEAPEPPFDPRLDASTRPPAVAGDTPASPAVRTRRPFDEGVPPVPEEDVDIPTPFEPGIVAASGLNETKLPCDMTLIEPIPVQSRPEERRPTPIDLPAVDASGDASVPPFLARAAGGTVVTAFDRAAIDGPVDDFHERATLVVDEAGVPPVDQRPSARTRRGRGRT